MQPSLRGSSKHLECFRIEPPDGDVAEYAACGIETERVADASWNEIGDWSRRERLHERLRAAAADDRATHEAEIKQRCRGPAAARFRRSIAVVAPEPAKVEVVVRRYHVVAKPCPERTSTIAPTNTSATATLRVR